MIDKIICFLFGHKEHYLVKDYMWANGRVGGASVVGNI